VGSVEVQRKAEGRGELQTRISCASARNSAQTTAAVRDNTTFSVNTRGKFSSLA
jgi:hypothetical protein